MTHVLAISPHLDDAAFSVGGLLAAQRRGGSRVSIVTCFTGNVEHPQGFALACQLDKGLSADVDYMALRRGEDLAACKVIGADAIHLPFLEAPHRGYASAAELFGPARREDALLAQLSASLAGLVQALSPDMVLAPLAIGDHVDHWMVRHACSAIRQAVLFWEDWPYLRRAAGPARPAPALRHCLSVLDRQTRLQMCAAYESQLGFQFGGRESLERQTGEIVEECLF